MRILLAAATIFELRAVIEQMPSVPGITVERVITGVGLVSATYHLQKAVSQNPPDLLIQAGIAGCFDPTYPLGSLVVVGEEVIGDLGVEEGGVFRDLFDLSLVRPDSPPYVQGRLSNPYANRFNPLAWPVCRAISVNEISTRPDRIAFWKNTYQPLVESMEGAALHFVCLQEKIPFLQIRSISNHVGERDKTKWDIPGSIGRLGEGLLELFNALANQHI